MASTIEECLLNEFLDFKYNADNNTKVIVKGISGKKKKEKKSKKKKVKNESANLLDDIELI